MIEYVDIVDANDIVIGSTTKDDVHRKGLLHRTVISQVKDSKGRWLFVKQAADRQDAGQYVSPVGGHVQKGETEEDALKREAREELGLTDFSFQFVGKAIFRRTVRERDENHYFIVYEIHSNATPQLNEESVDYVYFTKEELTKIYREHPEQFGNAFHFVVEQFSLI